MDSRQRQANRTAAPLAVPAKSVFSDVVAMLQRVVPDSRRTAQDKEEVVWVEFNRVDAELFLMVGYETGLQVWKMEESGEASEVVSLRQTPSVCATVVGRPRTATPAEDTLANFRPLLAYANARPANASGDVSIVNFISINTRETIPDHLRTDGTPTAIKANRSVVAVVVKHRICLYSVLGLNPLSTLEGMAPAQPGVINNGLFSLGPRWLAFASRDPAPPTINANGAAAAGAGEFDMKKVVTLAQRTGANLYHFGEQTVAGLFSSGGHAKPISRPAVDQGAVGVVKVVEYAGKDQPTVAHFKAHSSSISTVLFDDFGILLATADETGQELHVYSLARAGSDGNPQHLYTLHRGITTATFHNVTFSHDSRWLAATSARGTVHIFALNPNGGEISGDTHGSPYVTNASRFLQSSGATELNHASLPITLLAKAKVRVSDAQRSEGAGHGGAGNSWYSADGHELEAVPPLPTLASAFHVWKQASEPATGTNVSLLVCTRQGRLAELRVRACRFDERNGEDIEALRTAEQQRRGPDLIGTVHSFVGNMREMFVPRQLDSREQGTQEPPRDGLFVSHAALRQWDVCRGRDWPATTTRLGRVSHAQPEGSDSELSPPPSPGADLGSFERPDDKEWLTQVEIRTANAPHRRLWMGPQFAFKRYAPIESEGRPVSALSGESHSSVEALPSLYLEEKGLGCEHLPSLRKDAESMRHADRLLDDFVGSPASDVQVHAANESAVLQDLVAAMAEDWNMTSQPGTASGKPSGVAPAMRSQAMNVPRRMGNRSGASVPPKADEVSTAAVPFASATAQGRRRGSGGSSPDADMGGKRATFSLGMSPDSPLSSSPGGLSSSPTSGLGLVLGDADNDLTMHRVHSNVSMDGLADAFSDASEEMFKMD